MKIKHLLLLFATLFLPACSNSTNNNDKISRLRLEKIDNADLSTELSQEKSNVSLNKGIINDQDEVKRIEEQFNILSNDNQVSIDNNEPTLLSTFSTKVYTKTISRMNNLNIVCDKINGIIINPGEEFSYNDVAGPYDKEHGFGKATVLLGNGEEIQGYGGGVCQVSSTLYNAVKNCGVEITERHNHSKDVYYVPRNEDATVSYGNLDFKFKNLNDYPLQIQASANNQNVTVEIYKI